MPLAHLNINGFKCIEYDDTELIVIDAGLGVIRVHPKRKPMSKAELIFEAAEEVVKMPWYVKYEDQISHYVIMILLAIIALSLLHFAFRAVECS